MRKIIAAAWLAFPTACETESTPKTSDADAYFLPAPTPIVSQHQFVELFKDLCLTSPHRLSEFKATAHRLGLKHTLNADRLRLVYEVNEWKSAKDATKSALEISVG